MDEHGKAMPGEFAAAPRQRFPGLQNADGSQPSIAEPYDDDHLSILQIALRPHGPQSLSDAEWELVHNIGPCSWVVVFGLAPSQEAMGVWGQKAVCAIEGFLNKFVVSARQEEAQPGDAERGCDDVKEWTKPEDAKHDAGDEEDIQREDAQRGKRKHGVLGVPTMPDVPADHVGAWQCEVIERAKRTKIKFSGGAQRVDATRARRDDDDDEEEAVPAKVAKRDVADDKGHVPQGGEIIWQTRENSRDGTWVDLHIEMQTALENAMADKFRWRGAPLEYGEHATIQVDLVKMCYQALRSSPGYDVESGHVEYMRRIRRTVLWCVKTMQCNAVFLVKKYLREIDAEACYDKHVVWQFYDSKWRSVSNHVNDELMRHIRTMRDTSERKTVTHHHTAGAGWTKNWLTTDYTFDFSRMRQFSHRTGKHRLIRLILEETQREGAPDADIAFVHPHSSQRHDMVQ